MQNWSLPVVNMRYCLSVWQKSGLNFQYPVLKKVQENGPLRDTQ